MFRGAAIAGMILVSTPGNWAAVYPPLDHAAWHGWTVTDLVFPFLLFAMGAAIPMALERRRASRDPVTRHVIRRAVVLCALGLVLNVIEAPSPLNVAAFRIPGVLQRIAVVYLLAVLLSKTLSVRAQAITAAVVLLAYWAGMALIPVPGVGAGLLTPTANLASFIDQRVFGRHMLTPQYDPEGLLSTGPAIVTAMLGALAGAWLTGSNGRPPVASLWATGVAATIVGLIWGRAFPINKTLWTSSFTLFSAGVAAQALALCQWTTEFQAARPLVRVFVAFGRNALVAYFLSVALDNVLTRIAPGGVPVKAVLYRVGFASWLRPCCGAESASLAYAVTYVALWGAVALALYKRRVFIAV
jgi:predicted acyltransferase